MQETWVQPLGWEDPWQRSWQPTPVFLLENPHGQRRLAGCCSKGSQRVGHERIGHLVLNQLVQSLSHVPFSVIPWTIQHIRPPCPSPIPRVYPNPCSFSQWCHPTISFSCHPLLLLPSLSQHQGLFKWVSSSHQVAKVLEFQVQHQSFQWMFRTGSLQDGLVGFPCCPRDSQEFSPTPHFKSINSSVLSFLYSPTLTFIHDYGENHSFD